MGFLYCLNLFEVSDHQAEAVQYRCEKTATNAKRSPGRKVLRSLMICINRQKLNSKHVQCGKARHPKVIVENAIEHFAPPLWREPMFTIGNIFERELIQGQEADAEADSDKKQRKTNFN